MTSVHYDLSWSSLSAMCSRAEVSLRQNPWVAIIGAHRLKTQGIAHDDPGSRQG
jgi:hypothetical protein